MLAASKEQRLRDGMVIPAHPLALHEDRTLDEDRQRALTRYYERSGAGGVAVGVHTTQFEIRSHGMYRRVLELAREEAGPEMLLVAGVLGPTRSALIECEHAEQAGYDMALVATPGWGDASEAEILAGVERIAEILPVFGFYIQAKLGKRRFGYEFWRKYAEIPGVKAIKIAPFDRYATLEVIRAVVDAGRSRDVALYTGNDDNIVVDMLTPFRVGATSVHIVGGLLGQWAVATPAAVALHKEIRAVARAGGPITPALLSVAADLTDVNAAVFDAAHAFAGSIAGVNEVLTRNGLLAGNWCLAEHERLSPGQAQEIDRVFAAHPELIASR